MDGQDIHYESNTPLRELRPERLREGDHAVWTSPEGVRVSVEVRGGKVVRWHAEDRDHRPVALSIHKANGGEEAQAATTEDVPFPPPPRPDLEASGCWVCFPNPLPTGPRRLCYRIPCYQ